MSVWSSSQALAELLACTYPSGGAGNLPECEASVQALVVGHSRERVAGAARDSKDNLVFVASAQLLMWKDNGVENNDLSGNGDAAAQDCDGWCEAPIPEKGLTVDLGIGIIGVGVARRSFDPGPAPNCAVPAHNGIEDTGVVMEGGAVQDDGLSHTHTSAHCHTLPNGDIGAQL